MSSDKDIAIRVENLSKMYRLGSVGTGTLSHDLNVYWHKLRGKGNPYSRVGEENNREQQGESDYVWALRDINFEVKKGEILGIIGKNGAGKSTLLKILSRITGPTEGSIKVNGRMASLLEVGTGFHPELTGRENIYLNGAIMGMTKREITSKLEEIVDFSGCARYIDTPVKRYSSGMMVRLGFAVAAFLEPEILVVDEVLAVGDVEFQKKAIGKMQDVSKGEGRTVLFVSHNMDSIRNLCTHGILMSNGLIREYDKISPIIDSYELLFQKSPECKYVNKVDYIDYVDFYIHSAFFTYQNAEIHFNINSELDLANVSFAFCLDDLTNKRITSYWNYFENKKINLKKGSNKISVKIQELALLPGDYSVVIYLEKDGEILLRIDDLAILNVGFDTKNDIYPIPQKLHGSFIQRSQIENLSLK